MERQDVIEKLRQIGEATLPPGTSLYLYGSRARNDSHEDSDWDIDEDINPTVFAKGHWNKYTFLPFYKNVEHDKIVLL